MPRHSWTRRGGAALAATAFALGVAACTSPLTVAPAPYAADPRCASIMLGVPDEIGGLSMRPTSSQATTAYGDSDEIVVRCGVEPPGPSTDQCVAVDAGGVPQDWLVTQDGDVWRAVSFGRTPALEVVIPTIRADQAVGEILGYFNPAAVLADANGLACR